MRFAKNSNPVEPSGCPHPVFRYIVDCGWHTRAAPGRRWSMWDKIPQLIDMCNRALGCLMHEGQVWRAAAGFLDTPEKYSRSDEAREIVASAIHTLAKEAAP